MFASWTSSSLARNLATADPDLAGKGIPGSVNSRQNSASDAKGYDPARLGKLEDTLKRYEDHFGRHLRILLDRSVPSLIL